MTQCTRDDMRDRLPDLLNERLDAATRAEATRHVASCTECAAELELLRSMRTALMPTPQVDVRRIAAAVVAGAAPKAPRVRPIGPRSAPHVGGRIVWRIAAALVVAAVGLVTWVQTEGGPPVVVARAPLQHTDSVLPAPAGVAARPDTPGHHSATPQAPAAPQTQVASRGLVMDGGVTDLSDGDVRLLLQSLDSLTAIPDADPSPMSYQLDDNGGAR